MSSPLKAFRKHQKKLIVIFGVLLMVSFTVLASVQQYFQPKPPGQDENQRVVATWKGDDITRGELIELRYTANAVFQFLEVLAKEAQKNGGSPQVRIRLDNEIAFALDQQLRELFDKGIEDLDGFDMQMVYQIILARKAEELGVVVSDDTITRYFAKISDDSLRSQQQFEALFAREFGSGSVNYKGVVGYMRQMLLAQNLYDMGVSGLGTLSPGEAKLYHDRIYRKKLVELLPIKVADYLPKVTRQPSSSELEKLYQSGKDKYATREPSNVFQSKRDNRGADPGFRQRYQIQLGYFKGDADVFRQQEEAKITDEQIAEYYQEHKEDYQRSSFLDDESTDVPGTTIKPIGLPELDGPDSSGAGNGSSSSGQSTDEPPDLNESGGCDPAVEVGSDEPANPEDEADEAETEITPVTPADAADTSDTEKESTAEPESDPSPGKEAEPSYKPLEEVKDQIREVLAKAAVAERYKDKGPIFEESPFRSLRDQELESASRVLVTYARAHNRWSESKRQGNDNAKKPPSPDWDAIAASHNLTYGKTEFVDQFQLADTEIANALDSEFQQFGDIIKDQLVQDAFNQQRKLYQTSQFPPLSSENRYLYWKVAERADHTPAKEKILDKIKDAWRLQEARKLALADAEKKAAQVTGGKSLEDVFGKEAVVKPNFFSGLTLDNSGQRLNYSKVDGVDTPGARFHTDVANMKEGEVGIARNDPETVVYVVRVNRDVLFNDFTEITAQINNLAQFERITAYQDWLDDVAREMEVEWLVATSDE